ncbi:GNAT family N-acetyltransferase [Massilia sp. R2A-15]|uniref:GNAT family N-acetyltransferase n=1 Tax=Massilia sp. R2A-15 TaxID=3064278 RepID=UPI002732A022|nr:GNAT family N-acetyltransferase [Massilia sp. R2A-15]WLI87789.1 GNAT family N-acetyltransferase [Massilia sp. R2A-15]
MALVWSESVESFDWEALSALFEASPPLGNKQPADLKVAFGNSMFRCFVHDGDKLVGVGRALADGVYTCYIGDIAVHPDYRGIGLGKQIVSELLRLSAGHKKVILYAAPGAEGLYQKFGFRRMRTAMALFENQDLAMERGYLEAA